MSLSSRKTMRNGSQHLRCYEQAILTLDEALNRNTGQFDNTEKIQMLRRIMFEDVDDLQGSGQVKLPE